MTLTTEERTARATDLLQLLIRNQCVNDGTIDSGHEVKSADTLRAYLEGPGLVYEEFEPTPGRRSTKSAPGWRPGGLPMPMRTRR